MARHFFFRLVVFLWGRGKKKERSGRRRNVAARICGKHGRKERVNDYNVLVVVVETIEHTL